MRLGILARIALEWLNASEVGASQLQVPGPSATAMKDPDTVSF